MVQSIASSQASASPEEVSGITWKSILVWLWSAITIINQKITSSILSFRSPLGSDISAKLDVDKISVRLAIEERARSDGENEQPISTQDVVAGTQREIVTYFRELQRGALRQAAVLDDKLGGLREKIDVLEAVGSLRDVSSRCEYKVLRLNEEYQPRLNFLGERRLQQQRHYATFRENNQLNRVAEYPRSSVIYFALMAVLVGSGAVAIGSLTVSGVGGEALIPASWAISISLIDVLIPFVIAAGVFRSVNHVRQLRRLAGWLGGGSAIIFVGALGFLFAYYLSAVATDPDIGVRAFIDSILVAPNAIGTDVATWAGFGIVMLVGLLAFLIGYKSDDSYPSYGAVQRAFYRARNEHELLTRRLRKRINAIVDEARAEVTRLPKRLKTQLKRYARLVDESKRFPESLRGYDVALEDACNILLDRYRAANRDARQTEIPISFSEHISFATEQETTSALFGNEERRLEELHRGVAELDGEIVQIRQGLKDLNWRAISALEDTEEPGDIPRHDEEDSQAP